MLFHRTKDSQLKLRLMQVLESGNKYLPSELEEIVCIQCTEIGYRIERSIQSLLIGLGFEVKRDKKTVNGERLNAWKVSHDK